MARQAEIGGRVPALTLAVVLLSLLVYFSSGVPDLLIYNREAILAGELWRLGTAPLVHFSFSHAFWDILVFGAAGTAIEMAGYPRFWIVCGIAALLPGPFFILACPDLLCYGGLSALSTGAVAYLALCSARRRTPSRPLWIAVLALIGVKTVAELLSDTPIFAHADATPFRVLPLAHIIGCVGALLAFFLGSSKSASSDDLPACETGTSRRGSQSSPDPTAPYSEQGEKT